MLNTNQKWMLREGAQQFSLTLSEKTVSQFVVFVAEIQRWAKIANLLSQTDSETLIRKHVLDSLALLPWIPLGSQVLDLGSGAGFPGLPLAIAAPGINVTLTEARRKRANFLKESIRRLGLNNAKAHEGRVENLSQKKDLQSAFNVVTTRATWNIPLFLSLASPFLHPKGIALSMKGSRLQQELEQAYSEIEKIGFSHTKTESYLLTGNEKRNIAFFHKISP